MPTQKKRALPARKSCAPPQRNTYFKCLSSHPFWPHNTLLYTKKMSIRFFCFSEDYFVIHCFNFIFVRFVQKKKFSKRISKSLLTNKQQYGILQIRTQPASSEKFVKEGSMNKTTKRRFRMLSVFAMLMVIGCFCFTAMGASAASLDPPTLIHTRTYVFLQTGFQTDTGNTLYLGQTPNSGGNYGYVDYDDNEYTEVLAPGVSPTYYWAKAVTPGGSVSNPTNSSSNAGGLYSATYALTDGLYNDKSWTGLNLRPTGNDNTKIYMLYFTFAHCGEYADGTISIPTSSSTTSVTVAGISCTVTASPTWVEVEFGMPLNFRTKSTSRDTFALFGFTTRTISLV